VGEERKREREREERECVCVCEREERERREREERERRERGVQKKKLFSPIMVNSSETLQFIQSVVLWSFLPGVGSFDLVSLSLSLSLSLLISPSLSLSPQSPSSFLIKN
jgi:hypothetical protein